MSARLHTVSDDTRPAVEVHGLGKTYPGGVEAVRGIDFQVVEAYRFRRQLYYATCAILVSIPSSYSEGVRYPSPF